MAIGRCTVFNDEDRIDLTILFEAEKANLIKLYRVCHGLRLTKRVVYFGVDFDNFKPSNVVFEAAGAVLKIGSSLKPNHQWEI